MARNWLEAGARRLHLVDLNGAFAGKPQNEPAIKAILQGGRRRDPGAAGRRHPRPRHHRALHRRRPELRHHRHRRGQEPRLPEGRLQRLRRPHHRRPGRQGRQGRHRRLEQADRPRGGRPGARSSRTTASSRSSTPTSAATACSPASTSTPRCKLAQALTIPVIASGGLSNMADIEKLCAVEDEGIEGVICGRAIYTGDLDFAAGAGPGRRTRRLGASQPTTPP